MSPADSRHGAERLSPCVDHLNALLRCRQALVRLLFHPASRARSSEGRRTTSLPPQGYKPSPEMAESNATARRTQSSCPTEHSYDATLPLRRWQNYGTRHQTCCARTPTPSPRSYIPTRSSKMKNRPAATPWPRYPPVPREAATKHGTGPVATLASRDHDAVKLRSKLILNARCAVLPDILPSPPSQAQAIGKRGRLRWAVSMATVERVRHFGALHPTRCLTRHRRRHAHPPLSL